MTFTDGGLQPTNGKLTANAVTNSWGILTEPWIYVVDRQGVVKASFPSVFSDAEFTAAAKSVEQSAPPGSRAAPPGSLEPVGRELAAVRGEVDPNRSRGGLVL